MPTFAHIINPVKVSEKSDLFYAQLITFESMLKAKNASKHSENITLYTTQFEEDREIIPKGFEVLKNLERSVLDVANFTKKRKLPFIKDILDALYENSNADYFIFTNVDIILMPFFYDTVAEHIEQGHDAVVINRRRVSSKYTSVNELPLIYADAGKPHPGFDCFIFKRESYPAFILDDICVGIPFIGVALAHNIFSFAKNPLPIADSNLTKHIGLEVLPPVDKEFYQRNKKAFMAIKSRLKSHFDLKKFPYGTLPFYKRAMKWALNPCIFISDWAELEHRNFFQKIKYSLDEFRWRFLNR